jgi:hypothetical protein
MPFGNELGARGSMWAWRLKGEAAGRSMIATVVLAWLIVVWSSRVQSRRDWTRELPLEPGVGKLLRTATRVEKARANHKHTC